MLQTNNDFTKAIQTIKLSYAEGQIYLMCGIRIWWNICDQPCLRKTHTILSPWPHFQTQCSKWLTTVAIMCIIRLRC